MTARKMTNVEHQIDFTKSLFDQLVSNVNKHEEKRLSSTYQHHSTGEKKPYSKIPIQNDITKIRRELLALSEMLEDYHHE